MISDEELKRIVANQMGWILQPDGKWTWVGCPTWKFNEPIDYTKNMDDAIFWENEYMQSYRFEQDCKRDPRNRGRYDRYVYKS